jgi:hypothetical protein
MGGKGVRADYEIGARLQNRTLPLPLARPERLPGAQGRGLP